MLGTEHRRLKFSILYSNCKKILLEIQKNPEKGNYFFRHSRKMYENKRPKYDQIGDLKVVNP